MRSIPDWMESDREHARLPDCESGSGLMITFTGFDFMAIRKMARVFAASCGLFVITVFYNAAYSDGDDWDGEFQKEWRDWCEAAKQELSDLYVFDAKAKSPEEEVDIDGVEFLKFESIWVPYMVNERSEIVIGRVRNRNPVLRISYKSGLRIIAAPMFRNPIRNVFQSLVPEMPDAIEAYIVSKYGSLEGFTASTFGEEPDFVDLRFKGHKFTTEDIDCTPENIDETLKRIPIIMASGSADYAAIKAGEDVAYWSKNNVPGIVSRQKEQFTVGEDGLRVLWSGEFIDDDDIWQVIISFNVEDQGRYDRLGRLLAQPLLQ